MNGSVTWKPKSLTYGTSCEVQVDGAKIRGGGPASRICERSEGYFSGEMTDLLSNSLNEKAGSFMLQRNPAFVIR